MSSPLAGRRVLLGVTGGIAAYKAALLTRLLLAEGAEVDPVLTRGARRFIGEATLEGLTGRAVRDEVWDDVPGENHVAAGRAADLAIVYPATAHTLAKLAAGLADDLLTTTLLAADCPLLVAPAMHTAMWQHPATVDNLEVLRRRGVHVLGPDDGALMGGDAGPGRLVEPQAALERLRELADTELDTAGPARELAGRRVIVTAGGTREPLDPVRYLGNRSSGRMGYALAAAAARRGAQVVLVSAPTALDTPAGVERVDVTTALEMRDAVLARVDGADLVIKAAAVADFRPDRAAATKLKKDPHDPDAAPSLTLVRNPDILAELGAARGDGRRPVLVGFAAETDEVEANARAKLERKGADLLVVNDVSSADAGFEVDTNRVVLLDRDGGRYELELASKPQIADGILDAVRPWLVGESPAQ
ncbi:MAG: bifunctional phosphopantothenoylcysteine decarboxylase/phosphopantothenate--cysteine ligase CoaBC [Nitriliruptoraceae bacterium]